MQRFAEIAGDDLSSGNLQLIITRLADPPHLRGRFAVAAPEAQHYGYIPFDPDSFVPDVQSYTGSGGKYRLQVRRRNGSVVRQATVVIADPPRTQSREPAPVSLAAPAPQPQDQFSTMMQKLLIKRLEKSIEQLAAPPPPALPPAIPVDPLAEVIAQRFKSSESLQDKLIDKLLHSEDERPAPSSWVSDLLKHPAETTQLLQTVVGVFAGLMPALTGVRPGVAAQQSVSSPAPGATGVRQVSPARSTIAPSGERIPERTVLQEVSASKPFVGPVASNPSAGDEFDREFATVLSNLLIDLQKEMPPEPAAEDLLALVQEFDDRVPDKIENIETMLGQAPETIATVLATLHPACAGYISAPSSLAWIDRFKAAVAKLGGADAEDVEEGT